jgi:Zn-finger nucleic acid-binding protein
MQCPIDNNNLIMTERQGIEIDYCPQCRGVWLDRGELDKIIERSGSTASVPRNNQPTVSRSEYEPAPQRSENYRHDDHSVSREYRHKKHKKENFLGDLFDF